MRILKVVDVKSLPSHRSGQWYSEMERELFVNLHQPRNPRSRNVTLTTNQGSVKRTNVYDTAYHSPKLE